MKNILRSMLIISAVAAVVIGGTVAYFSDTEESLDNKFTAGIIDISVNDPADWHYELNDMKPGYVDYSDFVIRNDGDNPINVWKKVSAPTTIENGVTEPECVAYSGTWTEDRSLPNYGTCSSMGTVVNDLAPVIDYDLSVVVKDNSDDEIWNQMLYDEDKTVAYINGLPDHGMFLGMIPVGGTMEVTESYHMDENATNEHQSDQLAFDITLYGEQLKGEVVLEDKNPSSWKIDLDSDETATLTYDVTANKFNYVLTGKSPIVNENVALVAGYDGSTNPDTLIGYGITDVNGNIAMNGSVDLSKDLISAKVWLIPRDNWDDTNEEVIGWDMSLYLWETGLIDYYDTSL